MRLRCLCNRLCRICRLFRLLSILYSRTSWKFCPHRRLLTYLNNIKNTLIFTDPDLDIRVNPENIVNFFGRDILLILINFNNSIFKLIELLPFYNLSSKIFQNFKFQCLRRFDSRKSGDIKINDTILYE